jgi:uncharacterized protein YaaR (DUF327 family)
MDKLDAASFFNPLVYEGAQAGTKKARDKKPRKTAAARRAGPPRFEDALAAARPASELGPVRELPRSDEAVRQLLDGVHSAGDALRERPFRDEVLAYKQVVRDFLHYVVQNSYETTEHQTFAHRKKKRYTQVEVIDQKLEQLAAGILSGQSTQMELLSRLEEITGLLVDFAVTGEIEKEGA